MEHFLSGGCILVRWDIETRSEFRYERKKKFQNVKKIELSLV
jgi:hypothetical protein